MVDKLREGGEVVKVLQFALRDGMGGLDAIPGLVKRVIAENFWHERRVPQIGTVATFPSFAAFVTGELPEGLGTCLQTIKNLCRDDKEALDLIDKATAKPLGANQFTVVFDEIHHSPESAGDNNVNTNKRNSPVGNSVAAALRRLRKDSPTLHARVIAGELSPNAAMVEAGLRKKTLTVPAEPAAVARTLRRHFTQEELTEIIRLICEDTPV